MIIIMNIEYCVSDDYQLGEGDLKSEGYKR